MLILSKFRDYYDLGLSQGVDKRIIYNRAYEEIKIKIPHFRTYGKTPDYESTDSLPSCSGYHRSSKLEDYRFQLLGFCGKVYPHVLLKGCIEGKQRDCILYTQEGYVDLASRMGASFGRSKKIYDWSAEYDRRYLDYFFTPKSWNLDELHREYNTPLIAVSRYRGDRVLQVNPILKDLEFQRRVDPYMAFQEIAMYLSGVLGCSERDTVGVDDKHLMAAKGFDKRSFKRDPGTPDRKRK